MEFLLFAIAMVICGIPVWTGIVHVQQRRWRLGVLYAAVAVLAGIAAFDLSISLHKIGGWVNPLLMLDELGPVRNWLERFGPMGVSSIPPIRFAQIMFVPSIVFLVVASRLHTQNRSTVNHQR